MKILIDSHQLNLLTSNFHIIEEQGLVSNTNCLLTESMREFKVKVFFNSYPTEIRVGAHNSASALAIARLMFPKARVTSNITAV